MGGTLYISAPILDDLLRKVYTKLLNKKLLNSVNHVEATKGFNVEINGVLLSLENPRARLSRTERKGTLFSCLGELLWYLSGTNELAFISYYISRYKDMSDDQKTIHGGYGPRIFGSGIDNQVIRVIETLKVRPGSRQAVIQIFSAADTLKKYKDIPCTCTMQYFVRGKFLHMMTHMRSNDAFLGLPHDIFAFTMLQEIIARSLALELGQYKHSVGSLHLYDEHRKDAEDYISEGWQEKYPMPAMPQCDPWPSIRLLLDAEQDIRLGRNMGLDLSTIDPYWADIIRILQVFNYTKDLNRFGLIKPLKDIMSSKIYSMYFDKIEALQFARLTREPKPEQLDLLAPLQEQVGN